MTAPRIDTLRKDLHQVIHQIGQVLEHLDDLHALANDRPRAAQTQRVRGGTPDYSLDNHGDPHARAAYQQLADATHTTTTHLNRAITTAFETFAAGIIQARRDQSADATSTEVIASLAHQLQRHTNGQGGSVATVTQPLPRGAARALDATRLQTQLDALQSAVRKSGIRPDRSRLTPLELNAWQTATGTQPRRRKRR